MEKITILANRLAEAVLFDWDKEEVVKLAKEVAVACHENIVFVSLVKRMRKAQKQWRGGDPFDGSETELAKKMCDAERDVDEYLKKMEECNGVESKLSSLAKPCPNFTPKKK